MRQDRCHGKHWKSSSMIIYHGISITSRNSSTLSGTISASTTIAKGLSLLVAPLDSQQPVCRP